MTKAEIAARVTDLQRRIAARAGMVGYRKNVDAITAEIARLQVLKPTDE